MTNEEAVKGVMKIWTGYITAYAEVSHEDVEAFSMAIEALKKLKRYEPETVTNCHDLISKRNAYLALVEKGQASRRYKLGETWELNCKEIREVLDALPSAQPEKIPYKKPEIICCKDCRYRDPEDKKCDNGHGVVWQLPRPDDWFCADGKAK